MRGRTTTAAERRGVALARRRRRLLWGAVFVAGFGLGATLGPRLAAPVAELCAPEALRLRELRVVGIERLGAAEVAAAAGLAPAARLDRIEPARLAARIEAHPWIARARVAVLSPGGLRVAVEERVPAATAVLSVQEEGAWWVDEAGVAFAPVEDAAEASIFPRIAGVADAAPGRADPRLAQGVRIARAARAHGLRGLRSVRVGNEAGDGGDSRTLPSLRLVQPEAEVLLGGGELDAKLERLATLLAAELPEVLEASAIDLRFGDRMVLRSDASRTGDAEAWVRGSAAASGNGPAG